MPAILSAEFQVAIDEGLKHLDYRFGCGSLATRFGWSEDAVLNQFESAFSYARTLGLDVCPTLCFSVHESMERAFQLRDRALANKRVIRAIDLEGPEAPNDTASFAAIFRELKTAGFRVTVHAGEFAGSKSVWQAIEDCGAERIGHAYSATDDAALLRRLARDRISVEVCLTSNYLTGICKSPPSTHF